MSVLTLGEALIDFLPLQPGLGVANTPQWERAPGGAPANVAVGLARLGVPVRFIGRVGADPFGGYLRGVLADEGVDVTGMLSTEAARTALAFVTLAADGERDFVFFRHPSADMLLEASDLDESWFDEAQLLHIGSISAIVEPARTATLTALAIAERRGILRSFDANLRLPLWPSAELARETMLALASQAEIIKLSAEELEFLVPDTALEAAVQSILHERTQLLVVTLGAEGCAYYGVAGTGRIAAPRVQAIDATGAGDSFVAALLAQIHEAPHLMEDQAALELALRRACGAGALATTVRGAIPALPTWAAIDALLAT